MINILLLKPGQIIKHIRTQVDYVYVGELKCKLYEGEWVDCILYKNEQGKSFARSVNAFMQNFELVS